MKYWIKYAAVVVSGACIGAAYYFTTETFLAFVIGWLFLIPPIAIVYLVYGLQEYRIVRRNVSLDKGCVEKLKPYVEKHKGNFSAAIREIINQAAKKSSPFRNLSAIDNSLFNWMVNEIEGVLLPDNVLDEIIDPGIVSSMKTLEDFLSNKFRELEWDINIALKYDSNMSPSNVLIEIRGGPQKTKFVASIISQFLVKNSLKSIPLRIKSVVNSDGYIKVELSRSHEKEAIDSLTTFFGSADEIIRAIKSHPAFWKAVINWHILSNYNMVTVHRNYFEDLLADEVPMGEITIENMAKQPIHEIPLEEMLSFVKEVYESSRIVDRVEIDRETIILFHNYRNKKAVEKLKKSLVALLEANGHLYDAKSTANMIMLMHQRDVGIELNKTVNTLKISDSRLDQELIMFMTIVKGLKNIPDIPLSMTVLGRRIGESLMQEYEIENNIKSWNLEAFKKVFEIIDSKLHRESEWKLEGKNLSYTIKKCGIVADGNTFDTYVCHTVRETFKGALNYAFGNKAELEIKKLLTHGNNVCEIVIRVP